MKKYNIATTSVKEQQKVDELINECRKFTPLDGRVLLHALKIRQIKQKDYTFDVDEKSKMNKGKDPEKHRMDLKKVHPKVNAKYQEAVVLQVPFDETRFKVGDTIVYPIGCLNDFDLIDGVSVGKRYDIAAVVLNNGIDEQTDETVVEVRELGSVSLAGSATMVSGYTV
jgi:hypothetical protein